jgi:hypothetical protein
VALAKKGDTTGQLISKKQQLTTRQGTQCWVFPLATYKLHAIGDYPNMICRFGTADGYSTQLISFLLSNLFFIFIFALGRSRARHCKRFFPIVHKGKKHFVAGIASHFLVHRSSTTLMLLYRNKAQSNPTMKI